MRAPAVAALAKRIGFEFARAQAEDPRFAHLKGLHIAHEGTPVLELELSRGRTNTFSVTKSVTAILVGISQARLGFSIADIVERPDVTLHDMLSMQRGAAATLDDIDVIRATPRAWREQMESMERIADPGRRFIYDNCAAELVGYWLSDQTSSSLEDLARIHLFGPLGITEWDWERDPEGYSSASGDLALDVEDLARIGTAFSAALTDRGASPIPHSWARQMATRWSNGGPPENLAYGYFTWLGARRVLFAGWAGQSVSILPHEDLVIVVTGDAEHWSADSLPGRLIVDRHLDLSGIST